MKGHRSNGSKVLRKITALARFVKLGGKTSIVEFIFSKIGNQKSEAVTNMERFLNVLLGILQNFLKLSKTIILTRSCFWSKYQNQNLHFHCHNLTNYNWNQCHFHYLSQCPTTPYFFFFATTTFSRFGLSLSMTAVFWVWALLCALGLRRYYIIAYLLRLLITVIPQRDESSSFLFTFPTRYTWITLLYILIQCTQ